MKVRVFSMRFDPDRGGYDDDQLRAFMDTTDVIEFSHHFFEHERTPWLVMILGYRSTEGEKTAFSDRVRPPRREGEGEKPDLDTVAMQRFEALRQWRATRGRTDGVPPYVILVNRQLIEIARRHPKTKTELREIEGVGEQRVEKYGDEVLRILAATVAQEAPADG